MLIVFTIATSVTSHKSKSTFPVDAFITKTIGTQTYDKGRVGIAKILIFFTDNSARVFCRLCVLYL